MNPAPAARATNTRTAMENLPEPQYGTTPPEVIPGIRMAAAAAGLKTRAALDLCLLRFPEESVTAALFTRNTFAAAPVQVCREHLAKAQPSCFIINSGNANAAMGSQGLQDAVEVCRAVAERFGISPEAVLPFSTGVIGERLPADRILQALPALEAGLAEDNWLQVANAMLTTDTRPKTGTRKLFSGGRGFCINGIAKGAGMIRPDMATLLVFLAADCRLAEADLQASLEEAVAVSFNRISIDTDTSTNDSITLTATGRGPELKGLPLQAFQAALTSLCQELARGIVEDGEGVTRILEVVVQGAATEKDAARVAFAIAESPLVKTAVFAADANWGRIIMAIGKSGVTLDPARINVFLGDVQLVAAGEKAADYTEAGGAAVMARREVPVLVDLGSGHASATVWGSDLSHDYVTINSEYRT